MNFFTNKGWFKNIKGSNVVISGRKIKVDGKVITEGIEGEVKLIVDGDVASIDTQGDVTITGNVQGNVDVQGDVKCGNIGGDVDVQGNIECDNIAGDIDIMGNITHRK